MRRGLLIVGAVVAGLGLQACATQPEVAYGPVGPKAPYGYVDRQNNDGGFTVLVTMPAYAGPGELRAFFDRRAGELCRAGVARTNVFRLDREGYDQQGIPSRYLATSSQQVWTGGKLEGYVYCKQTPPTAGQ